MIPDQLSSWNLSLVEQLCAEGQSESDRHDFKKGLPDAVTLTKLACAFANSRGGFVIVGVSGKDGKFVVEGIEANSEVLPQFMQKVRCDPAISIPQPAVVPVAPGKAVYVFQIPSSPVRPHLPVHANERVFWKRTNQGCEQMTLDEIRNQFIGAEERRTRLRLLAMELMTNWEVVAEYRSSWSDQEQPLALMETRLIEELLVDTFPIIATNTELLTHLAELRRLMKNFNRRREQQLAELQQLPLGSQQRMMRIRQDVSQARSRTEVIRSRIELAVMVLNKEFGMTINLPRWS